MTLSNLTVVKVGGSLFDWPELPRRMTEFLGVRRAADRDERIVLLAGGGGAADIVRSLDQIHGLGDETAHRLALHAMEWTAIILAALLPGTVTAQGLDALATAWSTSAIPVLAPRMVLDEIDRTGPEKLPATWDVTSDSISAWLAQHLAADRLILVKSASLPSGTTRQQAARLGLIDPMMPVVARGLRRLEYVNLRESGSRPQLLL